jgi:ubiquitin carboxyl-terminal hydrolase 8
MTTNLKGLCGMNNLGNTCFINICIQILTHTYELTTLLAKKELNKHSAFESNVVLQWLELQKEIWSYQKKIISPISFIQYLKTNKKGLSFIGEEQDFSEFFSFLMECFHVSIKKKKQIQYHTIPSKETKQCIESLYSAIDKEHSEIIDLFYGVQLTEISCMTSKQLLKTISEPFFILHLSIPPLAQEPITINHCFDYYCKEEIMQKENAWFDDTIQQKRNIIKKTYFWSLPKYIVIDLKLFNNQNQKNNMSILFSTLPINLSSYLHTDNKSQCQYELYAICYHNGNSVNGGHYTCSIKHFNGNWYYFNDNNVNQIQTEHPFFKSNVYALFYRRIKWEMDVDFSR